mmetsp:Transcript_43641/g.94026  ORF Transcript_43641/g.94026 Transcript_43641/m.94026 type:complete len:463 (-) Transcript_43641:143-1531(-)
MSATLSFSDVEAATHVVQNTSSGGFLASSNLFDAGAMSVVLMLLSLALILFSVARDAKNVHSQTASTILKEPLNVEQKPEEEDEDFAPAKNQRRKKRKNNKANNNNNRGATTKAKASTDTTTTTTMPPPPTMATTSKAATTTKASSAELERSQEIQEMVRTSSLAAAKPPSASHSKCKGKGGKGGKQDSEINHVSDDGTDVEANLPSKDAEKSEAAEESDCSDPESEAPPLGRSSSAVMPISATATRKATVETSEQPSREEQKSAAAAAAAAAVASKSRASKANVMNMPRPKVFVPQRLAAEAPAPALVATPAAVPTPPPAPTPTTTMMNAPALAPVTKRTEPALDTKQKPVEVVIAKDGAEYQTESKVAEAAVQDEEEEEEEEDRTTMPSTPSTDDEHVEDVLPAARQATEATVYSMRLLLAHRVLSKRIEKGAPGLTRDETVVLPSSLMPTVGPRYRHGH